MRLTAEDFTELCKKPGYYPKDSAGFYTPPTNMIPPPPMKTSLAIAPSKDEAKLNKTERAYLFKLRAEGFPWIGIQAINLKLGDDCRYLCDFVVLDDAGRLHFEEVKGSFTRDDALVKLKTAARMYPFFKFRIVQRSGTGWKYTPISP